MKAVLKVKEKLSIRMDSHLKAISSKTKNPKALKGI